MRFEASANIPRHFKAMSLVVPLNLMPASINVLNVLVLRLDLFVLLEVPKISKNSFLLDLIQVYN